MQTEYVLEEGQEHDFYYKGHWYVAYSRLYSNGDQDVEVYLRENPCEDIEGEIYDYAGKLFEELGLL